MSDSDESSRSATPNRRRHRSRRSSYNRSATPDRERYSSRHSSNGRSRSRSHGRERRVNNSVNNEEQDLLKDRERASWLLARIIKTLHVAQLSNYNEAVVAMKRSELDALWERYQKSTASLLAYADLADAQALAAEDAEKEYVANLYHEGTELLNGRWDAIKATRARPLAVKPSEIVLPSFGGKYTSWVNWRSQFVTKVKDTQLSAGEKIDLLLKALTGEARQCAGETEHRDETDFNRMWAKLEATYDNKYQIVTEHIGKLLDLPALTNPAPDKLRRIVDTVEQELRSLERFGYRTEEWDPLVAVIVLRKLDALTIGIWEMDRDPGKPPSLKMLLPFMEKRILAIRNLNVMHSQTSSTTRAPGVFTTHNHYPSTSQGHRNPFANKRTAANDENSYHGKRDRAPYSSGAVKKESAGADPPLCQECKIPHFLWHCKVFKGWPLDRRVNKVAEWGICPCCLIGVHRAATCSASGCKRCDMAKHNNMLCPRHLVFRVNTVSSHRQKGRRGPPLTQ